MSYCRFGEAGSDVYAYQDSSTGGYTTHVANAGLLHDGAMFSDPDPRSLLKRLELLADAGYCVPADAIERARSEAGPEPEPTPEPTPEPVAELAGQPVMQDILDVVVRQAADQLAEGLAPRTEPVELAQCLTVPNDIPNDGTYLTYHAGQVQWTNVDWPQIEPNRPRGYFNYTNMGADVIANIQPLPAALRPYEWCEVGNSTENSIASRIERAVQDWILSHGYEPTVMYLGREQVRELEHWLSQHRTSPGVNITAFYADQYTPCFRGLTLARVSLPNHLAVGVLVERQAVAPAAQEPPTTPTP